MKRGTLMTTFTYTLKQLEELGKKDEKLNCLITKYGKIERTTTLDPFLCLLQSIISQQLSLKAASTITQRFISLVGEITPENILATSNEDLRACGLSYRKIEYIQGVAKAKLEGLPFDHLQDYTDEEVIKLLCKLKGVGVWTVEMLCIFSLERSNIFSTNDLALKKGLCKLYHLDSITKEEFTSYHTLFTPYASIASFYLWTYAHDKT